MDINFNKGLSGNLGVRQETLDASQVSGLASATAGEAQAAATGSPRAPLTITRSAASPEDISAAAIPESALTRTDALGQLVASAFDLPPPPMPNFASL